MSPLMAPADWAPHAAIWTAWPDNEAEWPNLLCAARDEIAQLCLALQSAGERVRLLVRSEPVAHFVARRLPTVETEILHYGDIWLRDTGPHFLVSDTGEIAARAFQFNGWGGRFDCANEQGLAARVAKAAGVLCQSAPWILEGGAVEHDGAGTCLTTEQCLLNTNRNSRMSRRDIEEALARDLGATCVRWLPRGLANDHTDGHIDNLARFIGPARVACATPAASDPNREELTEIAKSLRAMSDGSGQPFELVEVPSPGAIESSRELLPASYLNFVIANGALLVPQFGCANDAAALRALHGVVGKRPALGVPARALIAQGGALHCVTREQPCP